MVCFFLLFATSVVYAGSTSYCRIGADPVDPNRKMLMTEALTYLSGDTLVDIASGSGKVSRCVLRKGEAVVVDARSGDIQWVRKCGNPVMVIAKAPQKVVQRVALKIVGVHYTPPAMQDPGINGAYNDCPTESSCGASLRAITYGAIGAVGLYGLTRSTSNAKAVAVGGATATGGGSPPSGGGPVGGGGTGGSGGGPTGGGGTP